MPCHDHDRTWLSGAYSYKPIFGGISMSCRVRGVRVTRLFRVKEP